MKYDREAQIKLALEAIEKGMSFREADKLYGIPYGTLSKRYRGKTTSKLGAPTILSNTVENLIVQLIIFMADIGFGFNKIEILSIVCNYLKESNQTHIFKNGIPSDEWFTAFLKRHPILAQRCTSNIQKNRCLATQASVIDEWFNKLKTIYDENDFHHKPFHIFNCDESGFQCDQGKCKIICRKGTKHPRLLANSNDKTMYTVLFCCNAGGEYLPVNIIYKSKNLLHTWCSNGPKDAQYNNTQSGWMETDQFYEWFKSLFLPYASQSKVN